MELFPYTQLKLLSIVSYIVKFIMNLLIFIRELPNFFFQEKLAIGKTKSLEILMNYSTKSTKRKWLTRDWSLILKYKPFYIFLFACFFVTAP